MQNQKQKKTTKHHEDVLVSLFIFENAHHHFDVYAAAF